VGPARQALRDAAAARAAVAQVMGLDGGHRDRVCVATLAVAPVAPLVGRFRVDHPGITVRLTEPEDVDAVAQGVRTGASEIGFTELPLALPDLETQELDRHDFVAVVPRTAANHGRARKRLSLRALSKMPLITTPAGTSTRRQIDDAFAAEGLVPEIAVETDHREAIVALVEAGAGAAIVPRPIASGPMAGEVHVLEISPPMSRRIGLVHRPGVLSPAAAAFVALARSSTGPNRGTP
jgi:DNA-binding transcriptional LysR family regulator